MGNKEGKPGKVDFKSFNFSQEYKIVVVGSGSVGKSAITIQYVSQQFVEDYDPTIEDTYRKQTQVDKGVVVLDIIDTAGQEEYRTIQDHYWREADGFLCVYSIVDASSFEELYKIYDRITKLKDDNEFPLVIAGNKKDLEENREVTRASAEAVAESFNSTLIETSAKTVTNIEEVFTELVRRIRRHEYEVAMEALEEKSS